MKPLFITGIGTNVGKTITAAVMVKALKADYWKPIQTGLESDSDFIKNSTSGSGNVFIPSYCFALPASPNIAASAEGKKIDLAEIKIPESENLIIEGAGGLLVPINDNETILDLIKLTGAEVILVVRDYLGCINHTLLTIEVLKLHKIAIHGLVFNGEMNSLSKKVILSKTGIKCILEILPEIKFGKQEVEKYADQLNF